jgi:hypothetical protein
LREDEDGDSSAHFHAAAAGRRVVSDFVTHDCEVLLVCFLPACLLNERIPFMML